MVFLSPIWQYLQNNKASNKTKKKQGGWGEKKSAKFRKKTTKFQLPKMVMEIIKEKYLLGEFNWSKLKLWSAGTVFRYCFAGFAMFFVFQQQNLQSNDQVCLSKKLGFATTVNKLAEVEPSVGREIYTREKTKTKKHFFRKTLNF